MYYQMEVDYGTNYCQDRRVLVRRCVGGDTRLCKGDTRSYCAEVQIASQNNSVVLLYNVGDPPNQDAM